MKKGFLVSVMALVLLVGHANLSAATLLGSFSDRTWDMNIDYHTDDIRFVASYFPRSEIPQDVVFTPSPDQWTGWEPLIDLTLDPSLEGTTWSYDSADKGYEHNAAVLTNGFDDVFAFEDITNNQIWTSGYTSEHAWDTYIGHNGFDFEGFTIDGISFTLDQFAPDNDPGAFFYTVKIYGDPEPSPVPEPGTILLFGCGLLGFMVCIKRFRNKNENP